MLYLVRIEISVPDDVSPDHLDVLKKAEHLRARELASEGLLYRLWRDPTPWANWGLWKADDEAALRGAIATLPLRPYMTVFINPMIAHPSDPGRTTTSED